MSGPTLSTKDVDKEKRGSGPGLAKVRSFEQLLDIDYNPAPQTAPGSMSAKKEGHNVDNSIPLSIFPIALDKYCIAFCGLPGRGKTHISRRLAKYLQFFNALSVEGKHMVYGCAHDNLQPSQNQLN